MLHANLEANMNIVLKLRRFKAKRWNDEHFKRNAGKTKYVKLKAK